MPFVKTLMLLNSDKYSAIKNDEVEPSKKITSPFLMSLMAERAIFFFSKLFWCERKEKLGKKQSIHRHYCANLMSRTRIYWIPRLVGKCVAEITRNDVEAFFSSDEAQKLAPKTINSIIETITIPLKWAYYHELTENNCFDGIIKCSNISKKRKIVDVETATKLMQLDWDNDEAKLANELAMHTGMRAGEIQALTVEDLCEDKIYVRKSWSKYEGLKCCKNGEERSVPIPISHQLYLKLKMLADFNPHGNGFIFYSTVKDKPMDGKQFNKYLKRALKDIGYENPDEICFHSWRHFFCARMLDYVQDKRYIMALSGHKTEAMLNHYASHLEDDKVVDLARNVMKKIFIEQNEDEETIKMLNQKLEEYNLDNKFDTVIEENRTAYPELEGKADYIKNKPTILTEEDIVELIVENGGSGGVTINQVQSDWNQTDDTKMDYIKNKPRLSEASRRF